MRKISKAIKELPEATKGSWIVNSKSAKVNEFRTGLSICTLLWPTDKRTEEETEANADLIAAAPEMATWIIKATNLLKRLRENYPLGSNPATFDEIDEILQEIEG